MKRVGLELGGNAPFIVFRWGPLFPFRGEGHYMPSLLCSGEALYSRSGGRATICPLYCVQVRPFIPVQGGGPLYVPFIVFRWGPLFPFRGEGHYMSPLLCSGKVMYASPYCVQVMPFIPLLLYSGKAIYAPPYCIQVRPFIPPLLYPGEVI